MNFNGNIYHQSHVILILIILSFQSRYLNGFQTRTYLSGSNRSKNVFKYATQLQDAKSEYAEVCIVGGGPVGLATAIALSRPPHNYNCIVFESNPTVTQFNPRKGFLYNVNRRGREFTTKYPTLDSELRNNGVIGDRTKSVVVPGDPKEPLPQNALDADKELETDKYSLLRNELMKNSSKGGGALTSIWLKRHDMTRVLQEYAVNNIEEDELGEAVTGSVKIMSGKKLVSIFSPEDEEGNNGGVQIEVEDVESKHITTYNCNLLVGADGYRSMVSVCSVLLINLKISCHHLFKTSIKHFILESNKGP